MSAQVSVEARDSSTNIYDNSFNTGVLILIGFTHTLDISLHETGPDILTKFLSFTTTVLIHIGPSHALDLLNTHSTNIVIILAICTEFIKS